MRWTAAALLLLAQDAAHKDLKQACDRMDRLKSYRFTLRLDVRGETKLELKGEYEAPDLLHVRTDRSETVRKGERRLVKGKDGSWREPPARKGGDDPTMPHAWVRKIADQCPALKKEKSSKIGATAVDLYVHSLAHEAARGAFEGGGLPLLGSLPDWSKTRNGLVFYLGRDDLFRRVEQRLDGRSSDEKDVDTLLVLDFSDFNAATADLPAEIRDRLK